MEGERVSGDYFDVLGVTPAQARLLSPADDLPSAEPVAVISGRLWRRRFDGAADISAKTIKLDGHDFTIVGVTSDQFAGVTIGTPRDVRVPLAAPQRLNPNLLARFTQRQASWLRCSAGSRRARRSNRRGPSSPPWRTASKGRIRRPTHGSRPP